MNFLYNKKLREYGADFSLFLVSICWGATFFIVQDVIENTPVYIFLFWRFLLATILMALISYRYFSLLNAETIRAGIILGILMFLAFAFQTFGLLYIYSSTVAFITGLNVIIVPFIIFIIYKKKTSIYSLFGVVCAVVGLYFLTKNNTLNNIGYGEIYSFICSIIIALHIVFTSTYSKKHNAFLLVVIQFGVVALLSAIGAIVLDGYIMPKSFDDMLLKTLIITVIFATIFAFLVQTIVQKFTTPTKAAIIFVMEPVSAGIFGMYFAEEHLLPIQLMGAGFIIFGMLSAELGTYFKDKKIKKL